MMSRLNTVCTMLIFSLTFNATVLNAFVYDDDILNIFSKTLPRIILMSSQKDKIKDDLNVFRDHDNKVDDICLLSIKCRV